jgi:membrane associated rhomboid family serine protease
MVDRFRGTSIGLKLLCALLAFGFIVRLVVVLLSVNSEGAVDVAAFDSYVGFSTKSESFTWFWTWLTYSFFHAQVSHFIWNYLLLLLLIFWSKDRYAGFNALKYWIAGAACGLAFLLCIEKEVSLIGASSGITALWVGWLFFEFGKNGERGLSFWLGCVVFLFLEIIDIVNYEVQNLSLFAHIGGALGGLLMAVSEKYNRVEMNWIQKIFSWLKPSPNLTVKRSNKRFQTDDEFNAERKLKEDYLNSILDKISRSGFESLSLKEKTFLEQQKEK